MRIDLRGATPLVRFDHVIDAHNMYINFVGGHFYETVSDQ